MREFGPADLPGVASLVKKCVHSCTREVYGKDERDFWVSLYSEKFWKYTKGWKLWVLCESQSCEGQSCGKKKVVCCAGLNKNELKAMFVDPGLQGKGLGKRMANFVEDCARAQGFDELVLDSSKNAVEFYRKQGFEPVGEKRYGTEVQAGGLGVVSMRKKLKETKV